MNMLNTAVFVALAAVAAAGSGVSHCRCAPHEACWPSAREWQALNSSIGGHLISVVPVASVCHDPTFHDAACQSATAMKTNSLWRREEPGAVQYTNWEAWPLANQSCFFETPRTVPCGQGRISMYSAVVESTQDIQTAVRFAKSHNLRLVIKNSGHDYLGRSTAPGSLQIATFKLNDIEFSDSFVPSGMLNGDDGPAITISAGTVLSEMRAALDAKGRTAVMGMSHTVGAAGGYVQGGGHSPLGPWKGMASDNALEFEVVTSDGDLVTANEYKNQDLFWALRGGGGGTFGIVTKATFRTFSDVPMVVVTLTISTPANGSGHYWPAVATYTSYVPMLNDNNCSGYFYMLPNLTFPGAGRISVIQPFILCADHPDEYHTDQVLQPLVASLRNITGVTVSYSSTAFPKTIRAFDYLLPGDADETGSIDILGSRLISRELLLSPGGPRRLSEALSKLQASEGDVFIGHMVAGGAVASNGKKIDSALNPAWRKTAVHLVWSRHWTPGASLADIQSVQKQVTNIEVPIFKALEPSMGAYLNEADANEVGFQESFWGANYPRLSAIKQKWDPHALFIGRKAVGSEDWDDAGFCRLNR